MSIFVTIISVDVQATLCIVTNVRSKYLKYRSHKCFLFGLHESEQDLKICVHHQCTRELHKNTKFTYPGFEMSFDLL